MYQGGPRVGREYQMIKLGLLFVASRPLQVLDPNQANHLETWNLTFQGSCHSKALSPGRSLHVALDRITSNIHTLLDIQYVRVCKI